MSIKINYTAELFPTGAPVKNGTTSVKVEWDDILHAALTVGRPNWLNVFRHRRASMFEGVFRLSMLRMALEQKQGQQVLTKTSAVEALDPSEKGAVNYFLGMTYCTLFAQRVFEAPWTLHLDVYYKRLGLPYSGQRPDLIAQTNTGDWIVFESKGRTGTPTEDAKNSAKAQAGRISQIQGRSTLFNIAGILYHAYGTKEAQFFMRDPKPEPNESINIEFSDQDWRYHYSALLGLTGLRDPYPSSILSSDEGLAIPDLDIRIRMHKDLSRKLRLEKWVEAKSWCIENKEALRSAGYNGDGVAVLAGPTWSAPYDNYTIEV